MKIGRVTIKTQDAIDNPDHYARLFASVFFMPMQINNVAFAGRSEYVGHCHLFDDVDADSMIPAYEIKDGGKVERKVISFIKRGSSNG